MTKKNIPTVSVVMSVYNGEAFLVDAVDSILDQTYTDFEFIIVNDGSTDKTKQIVESYSDPRIKLINRRDNKGLTFSLNEGVKKAKGRLIARQDADDRSYPDRLEKQVALFDDQTVLVGSSFEIFDQTGKVQFVQLVFGPDVLLRRALFVRNPFAHGGSMFDKQAAIDAGLYSPAVGPVEDYDLWCRLANRGQLKGCPDITYAWRMNSEGISYQNTQRQIQGAAAIQQAFRQSNQLPKPGVMRLLSYYYKPKTDGDLNKLFRKQLADDQLQLIRLGGLSDCLALAFMFPYNFIFPLRAVVRFVKRALRFVGRRLGLK